MQTSQTGQRYCKECFEDATRLAECLCFTIITVFTFNRTSNSDMEVTVDTNDMVSRTDTNGRGGEGGGGW